MFSLEIVPIFTIESKWALNEIISQISCVDYWTIWSLKYIIYVTLQALGFQ